MTVNSSCANLRKLRNNPTKENLDRYENSRANTHTVIKESKWNTWRNYVSRLNLNTKQNRYAYDWEISGEEVKKITNKPFNKTELEEALNKAHDTTHVDIINF